MWRHRSARPEEKLRRARQIALQQMADEATHLGGDTVVGVDTDYEVVREGTQMASSVATLSTPEAATPA